MSLTPESLLQTLHTHLTHHATLLPQLHSQLGLPPSVITAEFQQLQQTLCDVVEKQITLRQEQVGVWQQKCYSIETKCYELSNALGGNAAQAFHVIDELKHLHVLPKRYDQLVIQQERLSTLYQEKLGQLKALTGRLLSLSQTLGPCFFTLDLSRDLVGVQPPASAGCASLPTPQIPQSTSSTLSSKPSAPLELSETLNIVTPERLQLLEKELQRGKTEIQRRLTHLASTLELVVWLCAELGVALPSPDVGSTQNNTVGSSQLECVAFSEDQDRILQKVEYDQILARFVARWDEAESEDLEGDILGVEGIDPINNVMEWADSLKSKLEVLKSARESQIQTMYDQLETLWKRLGKPDHEIDAFVEENKGSTKEIIHAYEAELEYMIDLKVKRMSVFIDNAREEMIGLWEELILGEEERCLFTPFNDSQYTEELLALHEEEVIRLKEECRIRAPLLASITKYFDICEEERKLVESASDQSRLLGRGPKGDPGRLLREERMRKRVKKEKPRLEQELLKTIPTWEKEYGREFLINGIRVLDVLTESADNEADKENKKQKTTAVTNQNSHKASISKGRNPGADAAPFVAEEGLLARKHAATPATSTSNKRRKLNSGSITMKGDTKPECVASSSNTTIGSLRHGSAPLRMSTITNSTSTSSRAKETRQLKDSSSSTATPLSNTGAGSLTYRGSSKLYTANLGLGAPSSLRNRNISSSSTISQIAKPNAPTSLGTCRTDHRTTTMPTLTAKRKARQSFKPRKSMDPAILGMVNMKNLSKSDVRGDCFDGPSVQG